MLILFVWCLYVIMGTLFYWFLVLFPSSGSLLFTRSIRHGLRFSLLHLDLGSLISIQFLVTKWNVVSFWRYFEWCFALFFSHSLMGWHYLAYWHFHLQAVCSVLRTPIANVDHLSIKLPEPDAPKIQWTLECFNGSLPLATPCVCYYWFV